MGLHSYLLSQPDAPFLVGLKDDMERLEELFIDGELTLFESGQQDSDHQIPTPSQQPVPQPPEKQPRKKRNNGKYRSLAAEGIAPLVNN